MADQELLLTVVIEAPSPLDKESSIYRRLMAARLCWESQFQIQIIDFELTTTQLKEICEERPSKYIVLINQAHQISTDYLQTLLEHLQSTTVYLAEPYKYLSMIPSRVGDTELGRTYNYGQDFDIHGIAFNTGRLADVLDTVYDLDRASLNLAYRLYWSIEHINPLATGYSVASDSKVAVGYTPSAPSTRLLPLIRTDSETLQVRILGQLVLYLRGLRESRTSNINIGHLRDLVATFSLDQHLDLAEHMNPFECAWIRWLADPESDSQHFKRLSHLDALIAFKIAPLDSTDNSNAESAATRNEFNELTVPDQANTSVVLQRIRLGEDLLTIHKVYQQRETAPRSPEIYDFYSRPVSKESTILFFDRPLQADDNAEYLYAHFTATRPEFSNVYFALNPKSPDWERLMLRGFKLVKMFSHEFYELFLRSDLVVSSQIFNLRYKGKTFANSRFVYLQHGVQINDMSNWVASKFFDVFVATGKIEADYLRAVAPVETLNSGLPRLQTLRPSPCSTGSLLFMPTWRSNLHQTSPEHFRNSFYFRAINAVLTDKRLLAHLESTNTNLQVKLHPNVEKRSHHFDFSRRVQKSNASYRQAISEAEFVFTDYSSAVLDAAFISVPIAYYQWDSHDFFDGQLYESRLDYTASGLGPVFTDHERLIDHVVSGAYSEPNTEYLRRREHFFEGVDVDRINDSIVERMLSL